ncbi:MAG: HPr family phosphocarrier protein [Clostridia bacterium]
MIKDTIIIENETGLHARPATEISKEAMKYKSDIKFVVNGKTLNAKSPLMIMAAGIKSKSEMEIICDGEDEKEALKGLMTVIKSQIDK